MRIKKKIAVLLAVFLLIAQILPAYAGNIESAEWYDLVEEDVQMFEDNTSDISPYTLYIMNVITSILKISSNKVGMRADIYCTSTMKTINVTFKLQKLSGSSWSTVGSTSVSASNVASTYKSVTASGLTSGTYRAKAVVVVTDKYGYSETVTGYSGSINI